MFSINHCSCLLYSIRMVFDPGLWHPTITFNAGRFILEGGITFSVFFITKCINSFIMTTTNMG